MLLRLTEIAVSILVILGLNGTLSAIMASNCFNFLTVDIFISAFNGISVSRALLLIVAAPDKKSSSDAKG